MKAATYKNLIFSLVGSALLGAAPAIAATKIGQFEGAGFGDYSLGLLTETESGQHAVIAIMNPDSKDPPKFADFFSLDQWKSFVSIWERARDTPKPKKDTEIGSLDVKASGSNVTVEVQDDGLIGITITDRVSVSPFVFKRKDVAAFDQDVKKISEFFGNPAKPGQDSTPNQSK